MTAEEIAAVDLSQVNWEEPQPKALIERQVRTVRRYCRGPLLHKPEEIQAYMTAYNSAETTEHFKTLKDALEERHEVPTKDPESLPEAQTRVHNLIWARPDIQGKPCGQDINALLIADGKYDGKDHTVICPKCETPHVYSHFFNVAKE